MRLLRLSAVALGLFVASPLAAQRLPTKPPTKTPPKEAPVKPITPAPTPVPVLEVPKYGFLQGVAYDSLHQEPLAGALILVEGTTRMGVTDSLGRFLVDSVPPGKYRLTVDHPILDTLGISLVSPPMEFAINEITRTVVGIPEGERLTALFCTAARRALGKGALVGRIREPDTEEAAVGARVSFVWYDPDPPGLPANLRTKRPPRVREAVVAEDGTYRLCGLPESYEGKLQAQRKDGGATAEVTVTQSDGMLALRSMSVAALVKAVATDSTGAPQPIGPLKGSARMIGRVLTATGAPVADARVSVMGASSAAQTRSDGTFVLDSLPSGTQALVIRRLGYGPTEQTVELSSRTPARVTVKLGVMVPMLSAVEVVSRRDEGLQKVGFTDRKRTSAGGHFMDPDAIERRKAQRFTDLLQSIPGIKVVQQAGQQYITSSRSSQGDGCVTVFVDGAPWQSLAPGDLDSFLNPSEVAAIEVYNGIVTPPQFTTVGQNCAAVAVWTKTRVDTRGKK
ncbi:MAG: carboxypeptidase regulatory-like domain-containing protein [Gemmatimonadota bacterium]